MSRELTIGEYIIVERLAEDMWERVPDILKDVNDKSSFILGCEMAFTDIAIGNVEALPVFND